MEELKQKLEEIRDEAQKTIDQLDKNAEQTGDDAKNMMQKLGEKLEHAAIDLRKHIDPNYNELDAAKDKIVN